MGGGVSRSTKGRFSSSLGEFWLHPYLLGHREEDVIKPVGSALFQMSW